MIGKAHLDQALAAMQIEAHIHWRSFELDPHAPHECAGSLVDVLAGKYAISTEQALSMMDDVSDRARPLGIEFDMVRQQPTSTFDAQRLIQFAQAHSPEFATAVATRLAQAALCDGLCVSDHDVLVRLAVEVGLDGDSVRSMLSGSDFADTVRADSELARELGGNGVPFFVFNERVGVSGAQPASVLEAAIRQSQQS